MQWRVCSGSNPEASRCSGQRRLSADERTMQPVASSPEAILGLRFRALRSDTASNYCCPCAQSIHCGVPLVGAPTLINVEFGLGVLTATVAACRSASSSSEAAAASSALASIQADPGTQLTASLVAMIGCGAESAKALRSSDSAGLLLAPLAREKAGACAGSRPPGPPGCLGKAQNNPSPAIAAKWNLRVRTAAATRPSRHSPRAARQAQARGFAQV